jgi:hypothetical protein
VGATSAQDQNQSQDQSYDIKSRWKSIGSTASQTKAGITRAPFSALCPLEMQNIAEFI